MRKISETKIFERDLNGGTQEVHRFKNGYGASVIRGGIMAYGGLELAVIKFNSGDNDDWSINYDTPLTSDVIGYLTEETLRKTLKDIEAL